jgi:hypothetical protein
MWTTKYMIEYSTNGIDFTPINKEFIGNSDNKTIIKNYLSPLPLINAQFIKFKPTAWSQYGLSMRADVLING